MARAASPERETVVFSATWDVGVGSNVYVVGSHADLGSWSPSNAIKLRWTAGNVWTGQVAIQKGTTFEYKFIARDGSTSRYCDAANVLWEPGGNRTNATTSAPAAPYAGKTVFYYSGWTSASLLVVTSTGFPLYPMQRLGPGRTTNESLFRVDAVGLAGEGMEFVFNGWSHGTNYWDNPPYTNWNNNYFTPLDTFLVQDGSVYNYWPSNTVSAPRSESRFVNSSVPAITGRTIHIYLPRGYDSHSWKRYPVIYMQDGQNLADPADPGGTGSWQADATAAREISQGRMREAIIVGVDNIPTYRRTEYEPAGDTYVGEVPGIANEYLRFLVDNVRPTLDVNYRTLNDFRNTFVGGSSMGGIFSVYAGFETNVFGGVLAMSPSFTRAPNYKAALPSKPKRPRRIYMDTGSGEGQVGTLPGGYYWDDPWNAYDSLLAIGYAPNEDLVMRIGCGHQHTERDWRARLPEALRFLLAVRDEPNTLAQQTWPHAITGWTAFGVASFDTQQHFRYRLQRAVTDLAGGSWTDVVVSATEDKPWNAMSLTNGISQQAQYLRVVADPVP